VSTPTFDRQILLPFAEKEWISMDRTARILGINVASAYRLRSMRDAHGRPLLDVIDYGAGRRQRVLYASVVRYCDSLRDLYCIPDRRPRLAGSLFRHRDEDLLPFPLSDTIDVTRALACVGYESEEGVYGLIEEGAFEAYRILPVAGSPWRISRSSFAAWLDRTRSRPRE
jgi:hypothetical protein